MVPSSSTWVDPASFPKAFPTYTAPGTFSWNTLPRMRHHHGDARADAIALRERDVADGDAGDVGDGVERAGGEHAGRDAQVPGARTRRLLRGDRDNGGQDDGDRDGTHSA
jgi:hypothetical protein